MKYDLRKIMTRAWRNFRKGGMSFAEALHRSWLSAKAEPINARRIAEAQAQAGVTEQVQTWAGWKALGREMIHGSKALFQAIPFHGSKGDGATYKASFFALSQTPRCKRDGPREAHRTNRGATVTVYRGPGTKSSEGGNTMQLISASEAVRLYDHVSFSDWCAAREIAIALQHRPEGYDPDSDTARLLACVFQAGRIQGIREERQRRRKLPALALTPCPRCGRKARFTRGAWIDAWTAQITCKCGNIMRGKPYGTSHNVFGRNISYAGETEAFTALVAQWNAAPH